MSIWGKLAGAAAGLAVGGPIGALIGGFAGHLVDRSQGDSAGRDEIAFTIGVIALGAKMAKADGRVTRDEISAFKEVFKVPPGEAENVARVFNLAKQDVAGYNAYARQLASIFGDRPELLQNVLEGLFHIASADGVMHPAEQEYLREVAGHFGLDDAAFASLLARYAPGAEPDPYAVLGVERDIDNEALKRRYRQLVNENHPDRAVAQGLPQEFVDLATKKLADINDAYDAIEKARAA
ncbi:MAG: TerB family tellurite resistance protein [Pseudomonadota bacterium]